MTGWSASCSAWTAVVVSVPSDNVENLEASTLDCTGDGVDRVAVVTVSRRLRPRPAGTRIWLASETPGSGS